MRKRPWPTKAVMKQIYENHLWGGFTYDYYSGEGSHKQEFITPYLRAVINFLKSHSKKLSICDLGCGDFNIGQHLVQYAEKYFAVDIVESLIERNRALFESENLEFHCLDIVEDDIPEADVVILRQVLQHLSNSEIKTILNKMSSYTYLILTEHIPTGNFVPNEDKITSQGIRLKQHSGVDILKEPFEIEPVSQQILTEILISAKKGRIVTTLYQLS